MITYKPGMLFFGQFCTQRFDTGISTDADSLPTASASRNGVDDEAFVLTVSHLVTGRYGISGTIPLSYTVNDIVHISAAATINGVGGQAVVAEFVIEEESGANVVTVTVQEADGTPIPDVSVAVFNAAETVKLKSGMTDQNGQLVVALNDGLYSMRLSKAMVNFTTPELLVVSGATSKTAIGSPVSPTAPAAGLQTLVIYPADLGLEYSSGAKISAKIQEYNSSVDTAILTSQILVAEDKTTHFEMQIAKGARVRLTGKFRTEIFLTKDLTISQSDNANLTDYL